MHQTLHKEELTRRMYAGELITARVRTGYTSELHQRSPRSSLLPGSPEDCAARRSPRGRPAASRRSTRNIRPGRHANQVELSRPSRSREHLHHVGARVQNLLHAVRVEQQVQLGGGNAHRGHHDPTQRDHPLQSLEGPLQVGSVLILPFILWRSVPHRSALSRRDRSACPL